MNICQKIAIEVLLLNEKYNKLYQFNEKVKGERNDAQDKVKDIKEIIRVYGFSEEAQKRLLEILDKNLKT